MNLSNRNQKMVEAARAILEGTYEEFETEELSEATKMKSQHKKAALIIFEDIINDVEYLKDAMDLPSYKSAIIDWENNVDKGKLVSQISKVLEGVFWGK